jgi:hypothetical protein
MVQQQIFSDYGQKKAEVGRRDVQKVLIRQKSEGSTKNLRVKIFTTNQTNLILRRS